MDWWIRLGGMAKPKEANQRRTKPERNGLMVFLPVVSALAIAANQRRMAYELNYPGIT